MIYKFINSHKDYAMDIERECRDCAVISLGTLMGEDHDIWVTKNKKHGYDLVIEDMFSTEAKYESKGVHPNAARCFADFCRQYLRCFDRLEGDNDD
jgi:hypothetical protein